MKLRNLYLALKHQLPLSRAFRNFVITRNAWGMFSKSAHVVQATGKLKVQYNSIESATRAAGSMGKKYEGNFRPYKCVFCDGFHVGKTKV